MASLVTQNLRLRRNFGKIRRVLDVPNLIEIQRQSYDKFLQADLSQEKRADTGLQGVFRSVFPITYAELVRITAGTPTEVA